MKAIFGNMVVNLDEPVTKITGFSGFRNLLEKLL